MDKRFLSIVPMDLLVIIGLGIIIFWLLKQLLQVVNLLLDILNILLMGILIKYLEQKKRITLLLSDTDSVYICFDKLVDKVFKGNEDKEKIVDFLDKVTDKIRRSLLTSHIKNLVKYVNVSMNKKM